MYIVIGFVLLNGFMYFSQPSMTFFPSTYKAQSPIDWGLNYEDVAFETADNISLHGWYIPYEGAEQTILFFHGNAGNISHRRSSIEIFNRLGLNVFIINYRGYGKSEGNPSEEGLYKDASASWNYLVYERKINPQNIIIFGRSLGGVVATELASRVQPRALIIESTFSSARDVANAVFPILSRIVILRFNFDTYNNIKQVNSPVLVLHSPDDEIVPFNLGKKVFAAANEPKTFVQLRGSHNGGFLASQPDYEIALEKFILSL